MIILREVPIEDLEAVLAFMYEGQVNVSQTRLHTFMKLAEALQVRGLTDTQNARARLEKVSHSGPICGLVLNTDSYGCLW